MTNYQLPLDPLKGVFANAIHSGIKSTRHDLSLLYVPHATGSAAVFTQHHFAASCVTLTKEIKNNLKALLVTSGNANACTGQQGFEASKEICKYAADTLGLSENQVGIASTGIIGKQLDVTLVQKGLDRLLEDPYIQKYDLFCEGILTTDTCTKSFYKEYVYKNNTIKIFGSAKGSGMIAPNMATMLGFITVNVDVNSDDLQAMLESVVERTFNCISVDSDTSTNDMVVAFSTGEVSLDWKNDQDIQVLKDLLFEACYDLSRKIVLDGEGATKCISVTVKGARYFKHARQLAKQVVDSPLVKTAIHGQDANWGRLLMALGKNIECDVDPNKVSLYVGDICLFECGQQREYDLRMVKNYLKDRDINIDFDLGIGHEKATILGCDLSAEYVSINTAYN